MINVNLLELSVSKMAGLSFDCSCGKHHSVGIKTILCGSGVINSLGSTVAELKAKRPYLLFDKNTFEVAGKTVLDQLPGCHYHVYGPQPVPDEACIGAAMFHLDPADDLIIAVGSGTLNDTARFLSSRLKIPYIIVCTAPSMDGYASTVSPMIIGGRKITLDAVYPTAIIADIDILKNAPMDMLQAGFGDIVGKYTALADWTLAKQLEGEYFCPESFALMQRAVQRCVENASGLKERDEQAVLYVTEALILSGIAMGLVGNSRPASGAEHHISHYWEVELLSEKKPHPLHGNSVGVGAIISATLYQCCPELREVLGDSFPDKEQIEHILSQAGCVTNPRRLGIPKQLFHKSVLYAMEIRERYTILRYLSKRTGLGEYADRLTSRYYE